MQCVRAEHSVWLPPSFCAAIVPIRVDQCEVLSSRPTQFVQPQNN